MAYKIIISETEFKCPVCGFTWDYPYDLAFNEEEKVPCCPVCGELIEDGGDWD